MRLPMLLLAALLCLVIEVEASFVVDKKSRPRRSRATKPLYSSSTTQSSPSSSSLQDLRVGIVGAGPSGLLLAHGLLENGASQVDVFEARGDPRTKTTTTGSRAYALGVGIRGRTAIKSVSTKLWQSIKSRGYESERFIVMVGRLKLKLRDGQVKTTTTKKQSASVEPSVLLYQTDLCAALLDELLPGDAKLYFQERIEFCDFQKKQLCAESGKRFGPYDIMCGCDGVNSIVRKSMCAQNPKFTGETKVLPGYFKVCRLESPPPLLDSTSVILLLPKSGSKTAFIEPTINNTSCVLFAGRGEEDDPILGKELSDLKATETAILERFPKLEGANITFMAEQLNSQKASQASSVQCNTYHYDSAAALVGDAAHATGGVSGQGVNSALVDSKVLVDCLTANYESNNKHNTLSKALLEYSKKQVPEGKALYDLSFGPSPKGIFRRIRFLLSNVRDTLFQGKFGIGRPPLQTQLTTSLTSFSNIRRERSAFYDEKFPSQAEFEERIEELYQ
jgi:kynurenine 3-monooxygenase